VTDVNDHDAGSVTLYPVDDPLCADSDPKQVGPARQGLDLSWRRIDGEVVQGAANSIADGRVECLVLPAGTRGQLNLIGGHPRLAL
jgi:hypothetical protein